MAIVKSNENWENIVDELVERLARPIFVLRMARPNEHKNKSSRTRARNARRQIENIIAELVWE